MERFENVTAVILASVSTTFILADKVRDEESSTVEYSRSNDFASDWGGTGSGIETGEDMVDGATGILTKKDCIIVQNRQAAVVEKEQWGSRVTGREGYE